MSDDNEQSASDVSDALNRQAELKRLRRNRNFDSYSDKLAADHMDSMERHVESTTRGGNRASNPAAWMAMIGFFLGTFAGAKAGIAGMMAGAIIGGLIGFLIVWIPVRLLRLIFGARKATGRGPRSS